MSESTPPNLRGTSKSGSRKPAPRGATITDLELAFAQDPKSNAFVPLCEAYMDQSRFMEAMVVCKKGIKAHPDSIDARVLLGRVYARQKKFPRALKEMDALVDSHSEAAEVYLARGNVREQSGDEDGAIADWKQAVDLDEGTQAAIDKLAARDIEYPEKVPVPPPPPPAAPLAADLAAYAASMGPADGAGPASYPPAAPGFPPSAPPGFSPQAGLQAPSPADGLQTPQPGFQRHASVAPNMAPGSFPSGMYPPPVGRQKLEGEDELEELAQKVANEKEDTGSPKMTLALIVSCLLIGTIAIGWRFYQKSKTEAIDRLMGSARAQFEQDTYRGYIKAAGDYERILEQYDSDHPLTTARLAHTYAILWGEHGEVDLAAQLDQMIKSAKKHAPDNSDTIAAQGLQALYGTADRIKASNAAFDVVNPYVQAIRQKGGGISVADMTLGLILIEQGKYDSAYKTLQQVSQIQSRSVRAKVLNARAAFRAGRLGKAGGAYAAVLRANRDHPGARAERALLRLQQGRTADADNDLGKFDEYVRKHPKDVSERERALFEYAASELARNAGQRGKAEVLFDSAVRRDPNNADFPYGFGRWLLKAGRAKEALPRLKSAEKLEPNRKAFQITLAEAEVRVGKYGAAEKRINKILGADANDINANVVKGQLLAAKGAGDADAFHKKFVESARAGYGKTKALLQQARYYRKVNNLDAAVKSLEAAIKEMAGQSNNLQGEVLVEYGRVKEATDNLQTALKTYETADGLGNFDGTYRLIKLLRSIRGARKQLRTLCLKYQNAGKSQRYYSEVVELCR